MGEPDIPLKLASPPQDKKQKKRNISRTVQDGEGEPAKKKRKRKKDEERKNEGGVSSKKKGKVR